MKVWVDASLFLDGVPRTAWQALTAPIDAEVCPWDRRKPVAANFVITSYDEDQVDQFDEAQGT